MLFRSCVFSVLLELQLPRLGKRDLILVPFVHLFDYRLFYFACLLFLEALGVWEGMRLSYIVGTFLNLNLCISNGTVSTNIYDKRDDFDFNTVNFPFLDGDVPRRTSYGVYISQIIRFEELLQILVTLTAVIKPLPPKSLGRAIVILKFIRRFRNFFADTVPW